MKRAIITDQATVIDIERDGESVLFDIEGEETQRFSAREAIHIGTALLEVASQIEKETGKRSRP